MNRLYIFTILLLLVLTVQAQHIDNNKSLNKAETLDSLEHIKRLIMVGKTTFIKDTAYSLNSLWEAARVAEKIGNDSLEAEAYCTIGDIFFQLNIYNRALPNYSRAANLFYRVRAQSQLAYALLGLAKSQYYRGNYKRSAASFLDAIRTSIQYKIPAITDESNEYLGLIYGAFQNLEQNTSSYLKSLEIKQGLKDDKGIVRVAGNLSQVYYQSGRFDSALLYANVSFDAAEKLNMPTDMYMAKFSKISSLIRLRKMKQAGDELAFFQRNKNHLQDANLQLRYHTLLGNYYLAMDQEPVSKLHYDSARAVINDYEFPELLIILFSNISESYYDKGDIKKAYEYAQQYNRQLSEFYTGDNLINLANLEELVSLEASKDEIRHLNSENKLKALLLAREQAMRKNLAWENLLKDSILTKEKLLNEALARENNYKQEKLGDEKKLSTSIQRENQLQKEKLSNEKNLRAYLLSGLFLFIALGTVIFMMYRKQRKKSSIIQKQADDLQTLMKEIHHRVKNNLQVISSLLDLQSISIKDQQASGAVREGKLRVQSMALIHQNLYNDGNIKGILMEDYINNLVENLFQSYNIQKNKICLVTDIDHLNLDVDTVIPLGLILNELISNSLKYAFKEKEQGEIFIALKQREKKLELLVKDNGCGFPPTWTQSQNNSFGYSLINAFAKKLKASLEVYNNYGACISMNITKYKPV
jgi:two-component sensor histidine kinase